MLLTVYQQFDAAARETPELAFLAYPPSTRRGYLADGAEFTYGAAGEKVEALKAKYRDAGYLAGHRVGLLLGNRPEHFWHMLALNAIGASAVLLNPDYMPDELAYGIEFAECALVVAAPDRLAEAQQVAGGLELPLPVYDGSDLNASIPAPRRTPAATPASPAEREALVIYTSGTTGRPKGCLISNLSCLASGEYYATAGGLMTMERGCERLFLPFPTYHMNVSVFAFNAVTRLRNCLIMQDRFHASTWWEDIAVTRATAFHYMGIVPPILLKAPESPWEKRHTVKFGQGAGVDPNVRKAFEARFGFPLIEGWGMTETSRAIHNCQEPRCLEDRAFGRPRAPLEVRVVAEDDTPLLCNTPGELLVRASGPDPRWGFFSGYLKQPEETERAWRGGWFHTGDIVIQQDDGMLLFVERRKNIIRRSGENIAAAAVENALIEDADISSVAVIAVPDEFHDEEIMACIVLAPGRTPSWDLAASIVERSRAQLASHKLPAWVSFVDHIPVTGTQKVRKGMIFAENADPRADGRSFDMRALKRKKSSGDVTTREIDRSVAGD